MFLFKYVIAALALSELAEAQKAVKRRGGAFKGKKAGKRLGKGPKGGKGKGPPKRPRTLLPTSSIQVQASQARSIFADEAQDDVEIVNYQDEPDYSKEYPEYEPELNSEMSNDFIAEVVAEEVEEPEEVEEADVQRSEIKLSDLVSIASQQAVDLNVPSASVQSAESVSAAAGGLGRSSSVVVFNSPPGPNDVRVGAYAATNAATTTTTQAPATTQANAAAPYGSCSKCFGAGSNTASTLAACDANLATEVCNEGDVCMIEVRRRDGQIVDMRTGCKNTHACNNLQRINFYLNSSGTFRTQCKPEDPLTGRRFGPSVCRQCFNVCDGSTNCFTTANGIKADNGQNIDIVDPSNVCTSAANCVLGRSFWDANLITCAADANYNPATAQCSNVNYPPAYDGYSAVTHPN